MLHPYPSEFPTTEGLQLLAAFLRGQPVDVKEVSHTAWHAAGFGLSQWDNGPHPIGAVHAEPPMSDVEMAIVLDNACSMRSDPDGMKGFDWKMLLPIFLAILQKLLEK